jgi:hypothetical protein
MAAIAYTGMVSPSFVTVAAPNSQASPGTGTNAIVSNAVACGSINALFVGFSIDITIDNVFSAGTGFTARYANDPNSLGMVVIDPNAEVTGTNTALWTTAAHGTDTFVSLAVAFADNSVPPNSATIAWVS